MKYKGTLEDRKCPCFVIRGRKSCIHEIGPVAGNSGKHIKNAGNYTTVYLVEWVDSYYMSQRYEATQ